MDRDERVVRLGAQRFGESDFLLCCRGRSVDRGRTELRHQLSRQCLDRNASIALACFDDLHQRRPAKCRYAKKATAKRRSHLAFQDSRVAVPEYKCTGYRPFARLGCLREHKGIRRVELYRAKKFHVRGPLVAGSNHAG